MNERVNYELVKLLKEKDEIFDVTSTLDYPTIAEVVMWLYEKYKFWIEVFIDDDGSFGYLISKILEKGRMDYSIKRNFDSIEKAYVTGIEYTLKNLINTK